MPNDSKDSSKSAVTFSMNRVLLKAKYAIYSALIFFLLANPETALVIQRLAGGFFHVVTSGGALTIQGLFLHTALFFLIMLGLMLLPSE
jgi:hypothetical protein